MVYGVPGDYYAKREVWLCSLRARSVLLAKAAAHGLCRRLLPQKYRWHAVSQCMLNPSSLHGSHAEQEFEQVYIHDLTTSSNPGPATHQLQGPSRVEQTTSKTLPAVWILSGQLFLRHECFLFVSGSWRKYTLERSLLQLAQPCGHIYCLALAQLRHLDIKQQQVTADEGYDMEDHVPCS